MTAPATLDKTRRELARRLAGAGLDSPLLDARLIVGTVLGLDLTALAAQGERPLTSEEIAAIDGAARRRLAGEPIARIAGIKEFWSLPFRLSAATLVPRPDTEILVDAALAVAPTDKPLRIADLGTGSGAILLALLHERPLATGVGTDISEQALAIARDNAADLGLSARADFVASNFGSALEGAFDLVVSNPPYIPSADIAALSTEVREHDPWLALDGGPDGLAAYRIIAQDAVRLLAPGGACLVEIGIGQQGDVGAILAAAGLLPDQPPRCDLAGIPRVLMARRNPS
jgi:release factor glutamine methyltransferase